MANRRSTSRWMRTTSTPRRSSWSSDPGTISMDGVVSYKMNKMEHSWCVLCTSSTTINNYSSSWRSSRGRTYRFYKWSLWVTHPTWSKIGPSSSPPTTNTSRRIIRLYSSRTHRVFSVGIIHSWTSTSCWNSNNKTKLNLNTSPLISISSPTKKSKLIGILVIP